MMERVLSSFALTFRSMSRFKVLLLILSPALFFALLVGLLFWLGIALFLAEMVNGISQIPIYSHFVTWMSQIIDPITFHTILAGTLLFVFSAVGSYIFSALLVSLFVMPLIYRWVTQVEYSDLVEKKGGSTIGSIVNSFGATFQYAIAFIITLPIWLIPGINLIFPLLLNSWFLRRIFLYDTLEQLASKDEREKIKSQFSKELFLLGVSLTALSYIPIFFIFWPTFSALCYTHYCIQRLKDIRNE